MSSALQTLKTVRWPMGGKEPVLLPSYVGDEPLEPRYYTSTHEREKWEVVLDTRVKACKQKLPDRDTIVGAPFEAFRYCVGRVLTGTKGHGFWRLRDPMQKAFLVTYASVFFVALVVYGFVAIRRREFM